MWKKEQGFTITELLCFTALLMIICSLAVPRFGGILENSKLEADAQQMGFILRTSRQEAIFSGEKKIIKFYPDDNKYKIIGGKTYHFNTGINFVGRTTFQQELNRLPVCSFYPSGAPGSGGTVTLENEYKKRMYIIVNPVAGRVRVANEPPAHWES